MNHELQKGPLLNEEGNLTEAGFAYQLVKEYDRSKIKAGKLRIKEWDYYYIGNNHYGVALTIADNSYMSLVSVSVFDFDEKKDHTKSIMGWFTNGKIGFPSTSLIGDVKLIKKNFSMEFKNDGKERHLICSMKNFKNKEDFSCNIILKQEIDDTMVIATPFNKDKHFYYNQKINCLKATGAMTIGSKVYDLNGMHGVLDWGRGVWTYKNTWYWSSMSGVSNGKNIGFNLGYGFGDTSKASENMLFYNNQAYKLNDVIFNIPKDEKGNEKYLEPWTFTSSDGAIDLKFKPLIDRYSGSNVIIIKSIQHQVFGLFSGTFTVNNEKIHFDNIVGFAEKVYNCW